MSSDINSPFNWKLDPRPSIFATDPSFRAGKNGKSISENQSEHLNKRREVDPSIGTIKQIGTGTRRKKEEERMLAYRQFGVYAKAHPAKIANKIEDKK